MISAVTFLLLALIPRIYSQGCTINVGIIYPSPLLLDSQYNFLYPTGPNDYTYSVVIPERDIIILACPGSNFTLFQDSSIVLLICDRDDQFTHEGQTARFENFSCTESPRSTTRTTSRSCGQGSSIIEIGFEISNVIFEKLSEVCFNFSSKSPVYTWYPLRNAKKFFLQNHPSDLIEDSEFFDFGRSMEEIYNSAVETINDLVGLPPTSSVYLGYTEQILGSTSLLAYQPVLDAIKRYINVWPQRVYNNWLQLKVDEQTYVNNYDLNLQVYSGASGVLTVRDIAGRDVKLYLHSEDEAQFIPVPELTWSVYYQEETKKAIAVLVVNTDIDVDKYVICKDLSGALDWLTPFSLTHNYSDPTFGVTYTCSYQTLKTIISNVPELDVEDILN